jgi:predicted NUDIX family NTP pyrophosphohydrolase
MPLKMEGSSASGGGQLSGSSRGGRVARLSAGLLVYRIGDDRVVEVLLVHPGGPFWAKRDDAAWSIPKGEHEPSDDPWAVATREFEEELGAAAPLGERVDLGEVRQSSDKRVHAWAIEGNFDAATVHSNSFTMEWPPRSGTSQEFPEVDRAEWMPVTRARTKLVKGQVQFLDRLMAALRATHAAEAPSATMPREGDG